MRIIFCLGVGVFFYGTFFGGEASKKKFDVPFLGCIDPSDPNLFTIPGTQKLHGLDDSPSIHAREELKGVVGDFLLEILSGWLLGSGNVEEADAVENIAGSQGLNGTIDSNTGDGVGKC